MKFGRHLGRNTIITTSFSWLRDFKRFGGKASYRLMNRDPEAECRFADGAIMSQINCCTEVTSLFLQTIGSAAIVVPANSNN